MSLAGLHQEGGCLELSRLGPRCGLAAGEEAQALSVVRRSAGYSQTSSPKTPARAPSDTVGTR